MKKNKKIITSAPIYPSATLMLEISREEYTRERERSDSLDNKGSVFISAILALLALYLPLIPFRSLKGIYQSGEVSAILSTTICLCMMALALFFMVAALFFLISSLSLKPFLRVNFENLNDEGTLTKDRNAVERGLLEHYHTILTKNVEINDRKAGKLTRGIRYSVLGFALLSLAAVSIIIIIG